MTRRYYTPPFGPVWAMYPDGDIPEVQITNPAGGTLGGDEYYIHVEVGAGAAATLTTQGATRVYRGPPASQTASMHLCEGSFLEYLPHHLIPYRGSTYTQRSAFDLERGASLLAWEAVSAGRLGFGERFKFDRLSLRSRICMEGQPLVLDGMELKGDHEHFGGYSYSGGVYVAGVEYARPLAEALHRSLEGPEALASASAPAVGLCVARILTRDAPSLYRALNACRGVARHYLGQTRDCGAVR